MNRHCVARMVIACILSTLLGGAWFPCEAQQKQIIRIKGSNAMANVTDRIAAEFMNVWTLEEIARLADQIMVTIYLLHSE